MTDKFENNHVDCLGDNTKKCIISFSVQWRNMWKNKNK